LKNGRSEVYIIFIFKSLTELGVFRKFIFLANDWMRNDKAQSLDLGSIFEEKSVGKDETLQMIARNEGYTIPTGIKGWIIAAGILPAAMLL
jgi:hypothetical protein